MTPLEWFFFFHAPARLKDCLCGRESFLSAFGHVQAACYNIDGTWLFFDPRGAGTGVVLTHHYDEVSELLGTKIVLSRATYRISPQQSQITYPALLPHLHCVTQCAAFLGWRAYTPRSFERMLLSNGAEKVDASTEI